MVDRSVQEYSGTIRCCGCGNCSLICKFNAIEMKKDKEGFYQPVVDTKKCINCGVCKKECPFNNHERNFKEEINRILIAYHKIEDNLKFSTSGGVAQAFYQSIIAIGGVCYGAKYEDDFNVIIDSFDTEKEMLPFLGTKYGQAYKGEIFRDVKKNLERGKIVLYIGTPCEIGALKAFLKMDYEYLYTVQIICMGVTSSSILKGYISSLKIKPVQKIQERYTFKNWSVPYIKLNTIDGKTYLKKYDSSKYAFGFGKFGRLSCYDCTYKGNNRVADITIGDYWGANLEDPLYQKYGMSIVNIHTNKGAKLLGISKELLNIHEIEKYDFSKNNPYTSISRNNLAVRELFKYNMEHYGCEKAAIKTMKMLDRIKHVVIDIIPYSIWEKLSLKK